MKIIKNKKLLTALLIFVCTLTVYLLDLPFDFRKNLQMQTPRRLLTSYDVVGNTFLPYVIYYYGTFDFSQVVGEITTYIRDKPYYLVNINGGLYAKYPVMTGLLALPFYLPAFLLNKIPNLNTMRNVYKVLVLGRIAASIYAAAGIALFYLILKELEKYLDVRNNRFYKAIFWIFLVLYAFGSNTYTISSRVLWLHTPAQFFLTLSILLLLLSFKNPKLIMWQGLLMGLLVDIRTTNILVAVPVAVYVFFKYRKEFVKFALMTLPTILFLAIFNYLIYGSVFVEGYQIGDRLIFNNPLYIGIVGLLFDPGKGFLFTMPIFMLGIIEIFRTIFTKSKSDLHTILKVLGIAFVLGFILVAKWRAWQGADRFGPGLLTDLLPIIALFSYLVVIKIKRKFLFILFIVFVIYSILVHTNAVIFRKSRCSPVHAWTFYCLMPPKEMPEY